MNMRSFWLAVCNVFSTSSYGQPTFNPVEKGNRQLGAQIMLAPTDMFYSETILDISSNYSTYGLVGAFGYGWFIEKGWMVGLQTNLGFYRGENAFTWPVSNTKAFDIALVPVTRYYFNVDKKHRFKPFLMAGMPIVHTQLKSTNSGTGNTMYDESFTNLRGSFGFGAAYFGRAGSIDLNLSNMGFYLGLSKYLQLQRSSKK